MYLRPTGRHGEVLRENNVYFMFGRLEISDRKSSAPAQRGTSPTQRLSLPPRAQTQKRAAARTPRHVARFPNLNCVEAIFFTLLSFRIGDSVGIARSCPGLWNVLLSDRLLLFELVMDTLPTISPPRAFFYGSKGAESSSPRRPDLRSSASNLAFSQPDPRNRHVPFFPALPLYLLSKELQLAKIIRAARGPS